MLPRLYDVEEFTSLIIDRVFPVAFTALTDDQPTIVALATPPGPSGVAIVRMSGSRAWEVAGSLMSKKSSQPWMPRQAHYVSLHHPETSVFLDDVILLPFQAPYSFTGEDVVELQCHGGHVMPQRIIAACLHMGATLATRGEFTRRAMLNNKLDLLQAEALLDVIHAEGEALVTASSHTLHHNGLGQRLRVLKQGIISIQADIVAAMDYPEEVEEPDRTALQDRLNTLFQKAEVYTQHSKRFRLMREGLKIAVLGQPNAGKSSLFNHLLMQERSIVTDIAGTTRDTVSERLNLAGVPVTLVDTAGLRDTEDVVERLGVARSLEAAQQADAILYLVDGEALGTSYTTSGTLTLNEKDVDSLAQLPPSIPVMKLLNKMDAVTNHPGEAFSTGLPEWHPISVVGGMGLHRVLEWLEARIHEGLGNETHQDATLYLNERQLLCLNAMQVHIAHAVETLKEVSFPLDMTTIPLTDALRELDYLLGEDTTELVLDDVFSRFCVGK
jgi:tRNA modification GTPase